MAPGQGMGWTANQPMGGSSSGMNTSGMNSTATGGFSNNQSNFQANPFSNQQ